MESHVPYRLLSQRPRHLTKGDDAVLAGMGLRFAVHRLSLVTRERQDPWPSGYRRWMRRSALDSFLSPQRRHDARRRNT